MNNLQKQEQFSFDVNLSIDEFLLQHRLSLSEKVLELENVIDQQEQKSRKQSINKINLSQSEYICQINTNETQKCQTKYQRVVASADGLRNELGLKGQSIKRWNKAKNVLKSVYRFQTIEVVNIDSVDVIDKIIVKQSVTTENDNEDEIQQFKRHLKFIECCEIGSAQHLELLKKLIETDPKRYCRSQNDPENLVNKKNNYGETPLYIAAKHGNLDVIKLLLEYEADPKINSNDKNSICQTPLEAAVRWNHLQIVKYLIFNLPYTQSNIQKCLKYSTHNDIHSFLSSKINYNLYQIQRLFCCTE